VARYTLTIEGPNGNACQSLPSVTEIIGATLAKPQLLDWYYSTTVDSIETLLDTFKDVPEDGLEAWLEVNKLRPHDIRDTRAEEGTAAHEYLAYLASFDPVEAVVQRPSPGFNGVFQEAIFHWWKTRVPKVLASETVLYSLRHGFAGTCDLVVELDRKPTVGTEVALIDLKTRKANPIPKAYVSDQLQLAAYRLAWDEMHPENPIQATYALLALDDGSWRMVDTHLSSSVFLSLLDVYHGLKGVGNGRR
jgi:hypothetical protein